MTTKDDLRALASKATPEGWWADAEEFTEDGHYEPPRIYGRASNGEPYLLFTAAVGHNEVENTRFVAAASPEAVIALLDRIATAEALLERTCDYTRCDSECGCSGDALFVETRKFLGPKTTPDELEKQLEAK